jgi:hypothetical protein
MNRIRKMVARGFQIGNEVRDKLSPIHDFNAGVYIFVDNWRHPLGIKEDPRDLASSESFASCGSRRRQRYVSSERGPNPPLPPC